MALSELAQLVGQRILVTNDLKTLGLQSAPGSSFFACTPDSTGVSTTNAAGVPVDLTLTYSAGRCIQELGAVARATSGSIRIQDLGGRYAARVTYTNFVSGFTTAGIGTRTTVNGAVEIRGLSPTTGKIEQRYTDVQELGNATSSSRTTRIRNLDITFTDTSGVPASRFTLFGLPTRLSYAGSLSVRSERTRVDSMRMDITTPVELQPDLQCTLSGYRAGEIRAEVTGSAKVSTGLRYSCR